MTSFSESPETFEAEDLSLARSAVSALLQELEAYPKPGLVSRVDSGAHADMDYDLMSRSAHALLLPFAKIAAAGRAQSFFQDSLIPLGLAAEKEMLRATNGVNTHRGAIFSLGMLVAALSCAKSDGKPMTPERVREVLFERWGDALQAHACAGDPEASHGAWVRRKTGVGGAREEAARGFPGVFEIGIPSYVEAMSLGLDENTRCIHTLFAIMERVEDTNVIFRGGPESGVFVRQSAKDFFEQGGVVRDGWFERAEKLHRTFTQSNLSPGGCADNLAGTLLVVSSCEQGR